MIDLASTEMEWASQKIFFLQNSQWLTLAICLITGLALRLLTYRALVRLTARKFASTSTVGKWIDELLGTEIYKPIGLGLASVIWLLGVTSTDLPPTAEKILEGIIKVFLTYSIIKILYFFIDVVGKRLSEVIPSQDQAIDGQLVLLATRTAKVFIVVFGCLIFLQNIGLNVMSVVAGLGLGGLAFALAAQDTAANLFGSVTIIADKPFKVGDHIKVAGNEGTVEEIGFRSTRLRTFSQSLLTIPNSTMAKELIENLTLRPLRESKLSLGVVYSTTADQIEDFCSEVTQIINVAPHVQRDKTAVYFHSYGDFSLNIAVRFFLNVQTIEEEIVIREQIYLAILRRAAEMHVEFAYPTQTIHMAKNS